MSSMVTLWRVSLLCATVAGSFWAEALRAEDAPNFSRHVTAVFRRLGCNGGQCHGAVQGQNGFRLSLFSAAPQSDHQELIRGGHGRRLDLITPKQSLLLLKALGGLGHGGGRLVQPTDREYKILRDWIAAGAGPGDLAADRVRQLKVSPHEHVLRPGEKVQLTVQATFADGSTEDVTHLCTYSSRDEAVAKASRNGLVTAAGVGDAGITVNYRSQPVSMVVMVPRAGKSPFPHVKPHNFVDEHILAKLKRLNLPPAELTDDATFLRRACLDVTGELPSAEEVQAFLADTKPDKRTRKIDELLGRPGYAALWTMKFCDILKATDFGVYADGLKNEDDAPRFAAWVRARLEENTPYDQFARRILTATSREGRSLEQWSGDLIKLYEGQTEQKDLEQYARRKTLDLYWARKNARGVPGTMQVAHAFLGLRLECAKCHRHPHDVWQQDDLLSFANFFSGVRLVGFHGENGKRYPEVKKVFDRLEAEGKSLEAEVKKLKSGELKKSDERAKQAKREADRILREIQKLESEIRNADNQLADRKNRIKALPADQEANRKQLSDEIARLEKTAQETRGKIPPLQKQRAAQLEVIQKHDQYAAEVRAKERRSKYLGGVVAKRLLHADIHHRPADAKPASVTSPLGTQSSDKFRLLGETQSLDIAEDEDPRGKAVEWMLRKDNPFFAKAIVNRVWAHYFGRGIVNPPDDLSPLNPATHPQLLDALCRGFIENRYDLKWLHRTILNSRTYQQSATPHPASGVDRSNYAAFYYRRLPAEVMLDAINQATGTTEKMDMSYHHWPEGLKTVEVPYMPRNEFVKFVLEHFGRPGRNSAVQCDCERVSSPSVMQVLTLANHPRVWEKIRQSEGRVAKLMKEHSENGPRVEDMYLATLSRKPDEKELAACIAYIEASKSPEEGLAGVLWSILNTREFLLQH